MTRTAGRLLIAGGALLNVVGLLVAAAFVARNRAVGAAGVAVALGGLGLVLAGVLVRRRLARTDPAAPAARVNGYLPNVAEPRGGYEVEFKPAVKGKHGRPASLAVRVPAATPGTVRFSRRAWFDRLGAALGLARPVPTDDPAFDAAVAARATHDSYADLLLGDERKRAAVLALLADKRWRAALTGTAAEAVWTGFDPAKDDRPGLLEGVAAELQTLAGGLPDAADLNLRPPARPDRWLWAGLVGLALAILAAPVYPAVRTGDWLALAAVVFAGAYPLFGLAAAVLVRGTTVGHDRWFGLMGGAAVLLALGSAGVVAWANGAGCPGPAEVHPAPVVDRRVSTHKNSKKYHAVVADWHRPGETLQYQVPAGVYQRLRVGRSRVDVTTRPGRLGVEWEVGHAVAP